jgi:putative transposase
MSRYRDESDLQVRVDYIHYNPVKHGWANPVVDWPYSSFHRDVKAGLMPANWGEAAVVDLNAGER